PARRVPRRGRGGRHHRGHRARPPRQQGGRAPGGRAGVTVASIAASALGFTAFGAVGQSLLLTWLFNNTRGSVLLGARTRDALLPPVRPCCCLGNCSPAVLRKWILPPNR